MAVANPEKIILFGSHARAEERPESDLDLLIILRKSSLPRYKRAVPINLVLSNIIFPMDVIVYTKEEIDEWREVPQAFITTIIAEGRVLYDKRRSRLN
ncbi:MAG TPA: nucleotidyltransferase domain-containing protein [Candidatus Lokiarchaeia archaeon]|nr:nucleotidyltransferase domain-containing protein [Candidatus Lokiarchaeia archaeon]